MDSYKDLYFKLFAAIADAVESLEQNKPNDAHEALTAAAREANKEEVGKIAFYEGLYYDLRWAISIAVEFLEQNEPLVARGGLIAAMRAAEEAVVSAEG